MALTQSERILRARAGGHAVQAAHDSREVTAPARRAFLASFEDQVDPERRLPEDERQRRAAHAMKSYMAVLALKSAQARRKRTRPS